MTAYEIELAKPTVRRVGRSLFAARFRWFALLMAGMTLLAATAVTAGTAAADVAPSNDDISGATAITALPFNGTQDSLTATQNAADPTPSCGAPNNYTVWYSFSPSSDVTVQANTTGGDFFPPTATVYSGPADATTASPLTEVGCSTSGLQVSLTAGTTYYFMLGSFTPRPSFTFTVQAVVPPANDDIANATPVGPLPFSATQDTLTASQNPHDPTPSCGAPNNFTVWYSYTPTADAAIEATTTTPGPNVTVYTGPANATATSPLTQIDCSTSAPMQVSVEAGTTYYFMLGSSVPTATFTFDVQALVAPSNDDIGGATAITALPFNGTQDSLTATQNAADPTPSCGAPNNYTVWYSFSPSSDVTVQANTTGGDFFPPTATVYSGPAGATTASPLTEVGCSTSGLQVSLTAGTTYYFMLGSFTPRPSFTFTVQAVVPPANDDIANATPVGPLPFSATQDTLTASQNPHDPTPSCGAPNNFTVWYSYTPTADGLIQVSTSGGNGFPPTATAYSGPAGATATSPLTEVGCSTFLPLQVQATVGSTYYFMLGSFEPSPTFTFDVTAANPSTAPVITAPPIKVTTDPGQCGATVSYDDLSVTGNPTPSVSVSPPSGSFLGVGTTDVSVFASNAAGFASTDFPVTVKDRERPQVTAPGTVTVDATGPTGAIVTYATPTATDNCPGVTVATSRASGSQFPIGDTKVTATATDAAGNHATASFVVRVNGAAAQLSELSKAVVGIGIGHDLGSTVALARKQLAEGQQASSCATIRLFIGEVRLQTPLFIPAPTAVALIADARRILTVLGCRS